MRLCEYDPHRGIGVVVPVQPAIEFMDALSVTDVTGVQSLKQLARDAELGFHRYRRTESHESTSST